MIQDVSLQRSITNPFYSLCQKTVQILKSPLITALALIAIGMAILPLALGCTLTAAVIIVLVKFPHILPKNLLYEVAIADLIVRDRLSRAFSYKQTWWHPITDDLVLGGLPLKNFGHDQTFKKMGINAVCSILEEFEGNTSTFMSLPVLEEDWQKEGIAYRRFTCPDMQPMELQSLKEAVVWAHSHIAKEEKVYLHCKAGRGRSAVVAVCYLIYYKGMSVDEALNLVKSKRSVVVFRPCQLEIIREFARWVGR